MKKVEMISENKNYTAVNIGKLDDIEKYSPIHPKLRTDIIKPHKTLTLDKQH